MYVMQRVARNYAKQRGECSFEAQNVVTCEQEGGSKKDCARYVQQFKRWRCCCALFATSA